MWFAFVAFIIFLLNSVGLDNHCHTGGKKEEKRREEGKGKGRRGGGEGEGERKGEGGGGEKDYQKPPRIVKVCRLLPRPW